MSEFNDSDLTFAELEANMEKESVETETGIETETGEATPQGEKEEGKKESGSEGSELGKGTDFMALMDELKAMRQEINEIKLIGKDKPSVPVEEEMDISGKEFLEENPGAEKALSYHAKKMETRLAEIDSIKRDMSLLREYISDMSFEDSIRHGVYDKTGNFVEGHLDFRNVLKSKDFLSYTRGMDLSKITDPIEAIKLISKFKDNKKTIKDKERAIGSMAGGGVERGAKTKMIDEEALWKSISIGGNKK